MKKIILTSIASLTILSIASAQQLMQNTSNLINTLGTIVSSGIVNLLMGLVFCVFLFSIITFLWKRRSGDDKGLQDAKNMLGWSIIAMFVMVAIWGLVNFISGNLGIRTGGQVERPNPLPVSGANSQSGTSNPGSKRAGEVCMNNSDCISRDCTGVEGFSGVCR